MDPEFIEKSLGLIYLVSGLSLLVATKTWLAAISSLLKKQSFITLGYFTLTFGAVIIVGHNFWEMSPRVITTVIGWAALLKGFMLLSYPQVFLKMINAYKVTALKVRIEGAFVAALGYYLYCYGQQ